MVFLELSGFVRSFWMYRSNPFRRRALARLYAGFIHPGDLCFDIGAHIGSHLSIWLGLGARVVAVEPHPGCVRIIRALYGRDSRAVILDKAVSDRAGLQTLHISTLNPTLSTLSPEWIQTVRQDRDFAANTWDAAVEVEATTLDLLIDRYGEPEFCKIDVEGAESRVLKGLSRPLRSLSFEYIAGAIGPALESVDRLDKLGPYEFNWVPGEGNPFQSAGWLNPRRMKARLRVLAEGRGSGDVYARLRV